MKIALIAHDNLKASLVAFVKKNQDFLARQRLVGTASTASLIEAETGLDIDKCLSGPYGGDQQIGSLIAQEEIDLMIFFRDPLTAQPHEPDVSALLRLADVHRIACASNEQTAQLLIQALKGEVQKSNEKE